jgi:hypothetical protein
MRIILVSRLIGILLFISRRGVLFDILANQLAFIFGRKLEVELIGEAAFEGCSRWSAARFEPGSQIKRIGSFTFRMTAL